MKPLLFLILSFISAIAYGQSYIPHDRINVHIPRLVSATAKDIWVIYRDKQKNYWFGSNSKGVYKYDGKSITHYTTKDGLGSDHILEIKGDKYYGVYINTTAGVNHFNGLRFGTLPTAIPGKWESKPGNLWFKGDKGPYRYDGEKVYRLKFPKHPLEDDYYTRFPNTPIDPYDVYYIYTDRKGNVWFGTGSLGVYRFDGKTASNLYEDHLTNIKGGGSFGIRSIMQDSKGTYWICNTKHRYTIQPGEKKKEVISYTREKGIDNVKHPKTGDRIYFQSIAEDDKGHIWLQTYSTGIYRYDGNTLTHYPVKDGTETVNIISMYRDGDGGLWLGTENKGVYTFDGKAFVPFEIKKR